MVSLASMTTSPLRAVMVPAMLAASDPSITPPVGTSMRINPAPLPSGATAPGSTPGVVKTLPEEL